MNAKRLLIALLCCFSLFTWFLPSISSNGSPTIYNGFSNYPYPLTTSAVQDIIDLMADHDLNVYRISCRPSYSEGSHPYEPELIEYFLDHAPGNMIIIVDANHLLYGTTYTQEAFSKWESHIKPRLLEVIEDFPNEPRVFVELINEMYVNEATFYTRSQQLIDYVEGLELEYYPVLVVNKLHTSGLGWQTLSYTENDIYQGYHGYMSASEITVSSFTASMQNAVNMGIKIINTEIGADSGGDFDAENIADLQEFTNNCATIDVGNCVWISWGTGWYSDYVSNGYDFDNPSPPSEPDNPPTYSNRAYNTTIADDPCLFSCNWTDDNGVDGSYFSTNNTGTWANGTWLDLSGTSWANFTTTLNSTGGLNIQFRWYANDTADQWTTTSVQSLTTQSINNVPICSEAGVNSVIAGENTIFSLTCSDIEGLSGYIFGTNNTGTWINETWADIGVGDPKSALVEVAKTLNDTVGITIRWQVWVNDTDDIWSNSDSYFVTAEHPPPLDLFFSSQELMDRNGQYIAMERPYFLASNGTITDFTYSTSHFTYTVEATGMSMTQICTNGKGDPSSVEGAAYFFNETADSLTLNVTHSSPEEVDIFWLYVMDFNETSSLGFMCDINQTLLLTVQTGRMYSGTVTAQIGSNSGSFAFVALSDCTILLEISELAVAVRGDNGSDWHGVGDGVILNIITGDSMGFKWSVSNAAYDWFSWMIMPAIGIFGFCLCGFGVFYVGSKIRDRDFSGSIRAMLWCMMIILIGAGLVIGWLW